MTPFLLAIAAVTLLGGGFFAGMAYSAQRIKSARHWQEALRKAHQQGVAEGTQRRAQNLPPVASQINTNGERP